MIHNTAHGLLKQPWLRDRFPPIYTVIINNFGEPAETPEHNQMQALFTDKEFCKRFIADTCMDSMETTFNSVKNMLLDSLDSNLREARQNLRDLEWQERNSPTKEKTQNTQSWINRLTAAIDQTQENKSHALDIVNVAFEVNGADVLIYYRFTDVRAPHRLTYDDNDEY